MDSFVCLLLFDKQNCLNASISLKKSKLTSNFYEVTLAETLTEAPSAFESNFHFYATEVKFSTDPLKRLPIDLFENGLVGNLF